MASNEKKFIEERNKIYDFFKGRLTKEQEKSLYDWIKSDKDNYRLFDDIRSLMIQSKVHCPEKFTEENLEAAWQSFEKRVTKEKRKKNSPAISQMHWFKVAATWLLLFIMGGAVTYTFVHINEMHENSKQSEIITPKGSKSTVFLPDGTKVILNADSKLVYDKSFDSKGRIVRLVGEGYFDVVTNKNKPFVVRTDYADIKAYGTVFNVKAYPDDDFFTATLVEGEVEVEAITAEEEKIIYKLEPSQNFRYEIARKEVNEEKSLADKVEKPKSMPKREKINAKKVRLDNKVKTRLYTSWKDEEWIIEGMPMGDMAVQLERRYNIDIRINSDVLSKYRFTGKIQNETFEQVLEILKLTTPLKYELSKGHVEWKLDKNLEKEYSKILEK